MEPEISPSPELSTDATQSSHSTNVECPPCDAICGNEYNEDANETLSDSEDRLRQEDTIRSILDQQSIIQFQQYAQEQHPKEPKKQEELVTQMQEQYFQYYMENVQHSQMLNQQQQISQLMNLRDATRAEAAAKGTALSSAEADGDADSLEPIPLPLIPASLWTRKEIAEFKKEILSTQRECCIKISSLASATLRVPTHEDGTSISWEFATDSYDIGFGLYFEWSLTPPDSITMTISESSDEEEEDDEEIDGKDSESVERPKRKSAVGDEDVESGGHRVSGPPMDELIPVYRRDSHLEVYCGSHQYPGCGVYVFKFDNSFSLWRSKWLYYRVFYGK